MTKRIAVLLVLLFCAILTSCVAEAKPWSSGYDAHFKASCSRWLPSWDWRWCKAQCVAESGLNPAAVSQVGAQGICQIMPATWRDIRGGLSLAASTSPYVAELGIEGAAYYDSRLRGVWRSPRPEFERRRLTLASYNAGAGNILKAQTICKGARDWTAVVPCLASVTGPVNARETSGYVSRIERIFGGLQ